ncbi:MAG: hypothetical protein KC656_30820, partial [Myxococcales bacterium]|nr:hypothetical protein [Myxococcales bacterium]
MRAIPQVCAVVLMVVACGVAAPAPGDTDPPGVADTAMRPTTAWRQDVLVRLDGVPVAGAIVLQGGAPGHVRTAEDGTAVVEVDPAIPGDLVVVAAHPEARSVGEDVLRPGPRVALDLVRFDRSDDPAYVFQDPGTPERDAGTDTCAHCHVRQVADWVDSVHARAASNPVVHDVYAGTARHDEAPCMAAGGSWVEGPLPGGGSGLRCRLGVGVLPDLDPACDPGPCTTPTSTGGCADCHAPALDGVLGGRDLLEARGIAFDHGIHCDLCHKVAAVHLERPAGVGGRLEVVRPSEPATLAGLDRAPLTFGPYPDVLNPRMGAVVSPLLQEATFCAGCHELEQAALLPGADVDRGRWPTGRFPVQSTFSEWSAGPLAGVAPCQSCHMPPDPAAGNVADLDLLGGVGVGIASGWWRPPGSARR